MGSLTLLKSTTNVGMVPIGNGVGALFIIIHRFCRDAIWIIVSCRITQSGDLYWMCSEGKV